MTVREQASAARPNPATAKSAAGGQPGQAPKARAGKASRSTRVLHFLPGTDLTFYGGPLRSTWSLCELMQAGGIDVECANIRTGRVVEPRHVAEELGANKFGTRPMTPRHLLRTLKLVRGADLVHLHFYWDLANVQVAELCRLLKVPYVISVHGTLDTLSLRSGKQTQKRLYLALLGSRLFRGASAIHVDCVHEKEQVEQHFGEARYWVFPPTLEADVFANAARGSATREEGAPGRRPWQLLYLSRVDAKKGSDILVSAADLLHRRGLDFELTVAGAVRDPVFEQHILKLVEQGGIGQRVTFLGPVTAEEKWKLYAKADLFVLPTLQENFGITLFEALAFGTPVLTTENVDTREELRRSGGVAFTTRSPVELADAIEGLVSDPALLSRMGRSASAFMQATFSSTAFFEGYRDFYAEVLGRQAGV